MPILRRNICTIALLYDSLTPPTRTASIYIRLHEHSLYPVGRFVLTLLMSCAVSFHFLNPLVQLSQRDNLMLSKTIETLSNHVSPNLDPEFAGVANFQFLLGKKRVRIDQ